MTGYINEHCFMQDVVYRLNLNTMSHLGDRFIMDVMYLSSVLYYDYCKEKHGEGQTLSPLSFIATEKGPVPINTDGIKPALNKPKKADIDEELEKWMNRFIDVALTLKTEEIRERTLNDDYFLEALNAQYKVISFNPSLTESA